MLLFAVMKRTYRIPTWLRSAVGALSLTCLLGADSLTEASFDCEQAVARLAECCPAIDPSRFTCAEDGCSSRYPDFLIDESTCIQTASCSDLVANGICARAANAAGRGDNGYTSTETATVCP